MACSESDNSKYSTIDGKPTHYEAILAISKDQGIVKDKPKLISFVTLESRTKTTYHWSFLMKRLELS